MDALFFHLSIVIFFVARLYHGWLVDPQNVELFSRIGDNYYNKCVELALEEKEDDDGVGRVLIGDFLESTSNQVHKHTPYIFLKTLSKLFR